MKRNQIIAIVGSLVIGLGVGFGSAYTIQSQRVEEVRTIAIRNTKALANQVENLMMKNLVEVKGEVTEDFHKEDGDQVFELTDGSWYLINEMENKYIFQPIDLGDWDYQVNSMEELQNIVKTYISMKNEGTW